METQTWPPQILLFFTFFLTIYILSYTLLFKNWPPSTRPEAASCIISFLHGTPSFVLSTTTLLLLPTTTTFSSPNTPLQSTLLDFSLSYFLTDLLHYLLFYPSDLSFISHHLATLFVFSSSRFLTSHGASLLLLLLSLAESSSALQNAWTLARARRLDDERARRVYGVLCVPFYALYSLARGVAGPVVVYRMWVFFYVQGGGVGVIPTWVWGAWIGVVVLAIVGSLFWVKSLWLELFREWSAKNAKNIYTVKRD